MKNLYIIIVHFGDPNITKKCLEGIFKYTEAEHVVIVNNDKRSDLLGLGHDKRVILLNHRKNVGFACGVNIGIMKALKKGAKHILLLNNDTEISNDFISPLIKFLNEKNDAGIVAPLIEFKKNEAIFYDFGGRINRFFGRTEHDNRTVIGDLQPVRADYVSGCCMMVKAEVIGKIGLFDENFFLYYEDVDYCLRAKKIGYQIYVVPKSVIFHYLSKNVGKLSSKAAYYQTKSALIFGRKHVRWRIMNIVFVFSQSCLFLLKDIDGGRSAFSAFFESVF